MGQDALTGSFPTLVKYFKDVIGNPTDLVSRHISAGVESDVFFLRGHVSDVQVDEAVLSPLLRFDGSGSASPVDLIPAPASPLNAISEAVNAILRGDAVVATPGLGWWAIDVAETPKRQPSESKSAKVIHGPHVGFIEELEANLALLRRYIRSPFLRLHPYTVGVLTHNHVVVAALDGVVNAEVLAKIQTQIEDILVDGITGINAIAEFLQPGGLIPTYQISERPDQVAAALLEGRVAILMDGTPTTLIIPATLTNLMTHPNDYYQTTLGGTLTRLLRYIGFFTTLAFPGIYVGIMSVNTTVIPISLALTILRGRLAIPFPVLVETGIMLFTFDSILEAGFIIPGGLGQTISVGGGLVLGQAAIMAGIVSAPTLIIIAVTELAQFMIPDTNLQAAVRWMRLLLLVLGAIMGLVGVMSGLMFFIAIAAQADSYGMSYLSPLASMRPGWWRDTITRAPVWLRNRRPKHLRPYRIS